MLEQPGFWDDVEHSQQVMKELKNLKDTIEEFETLSNQYEDIGTLIEMAEEEMMRALSKRLEMSLRRLKRNSKSSVLIRYFQRNMMPTTRS